MIINLDYFYSFLVSENKNGAIFFIHAEAPNTQVFWFQKLGIQAGVKRILLEKRFLFFKFFLKSSFFKIGRDIGRERENFHALSKVGGTPQALL